MTHELALKGQVSDYQADWGEKTLAGRGCNTSKDFKCCRWGCGERFKVTEAWGVWYVNARLRCFDLMLKPEESKEIYLQRSSLR